MKTDNLAEKLYNTWRSQRGIHVRTWSNVTPDERSDWEAIARVARTETMRLLAASGGLPS